MLARPFWSKKNCDSHHIQGWPLCPIWQMSLVLIANVNVMLWYFLGDLKTNTGVVCPYLGANSNFPQGSVRPRKLHAGDFGKQTAESQQRCAQAWGGSNTAWNAFTSFCVKPPHANRFSAGGSTIDSVVSIRFANHLLVWAWIHWGSTSARMSPLTYDANPPGPNPKNK